MENLKKLRIETGISQQKLAEKIGTSQQNIHGYEHGFYEPDIQTLKILAAFFGTSIDYLVGASTSRRKVELLEESGLDQEEIAVIEKWRQLSPKQRKCVELFLDALAE